MHERHLHRPALFTPRAPVHRRRLRSLAAAHAVAGRQLQAAPSKGPKAPEAPTLYDCLTLKKLDTLKKLVDVSQGGCWVPERVSRVPCRR